MVLSIWKVFFILTLSLNLISFAEDVSVKRVISVYDGDSFRVDLEGCYPEVFSKNIPVRLSNVDTPELRSSSMIEKKLAQLAKLYTKQRLEKAKEIVLKNVKRGKYFRIIADVYVDGKNLGEELIEKEFAQAYFGGAKPDWKEKAKNYFEAHEISINY